ncbi:hypothetical protein KBC55_03245 [Patescibacteria group bacterium]|nr:hypothetical protein [Patescibacteria group bacterium]
MEHEKVTPLIPPFTIIDHLVDPAETVRLIAAAQEPIASLPGFAIMSSFFEHEGIRTVLDLVTSDDARLCHVVIMNKSADSFVDAVLAERGLRRVNPDTTMRALIYDLARRSRPPRLSTWQQSP